MFTSFTRAINDRIGWLILVIPAGLFLGAGLWVSAVRADEPVPPAEDLPPAIPANAQLESLLEILQQPGDDKPEFKLPLSATDEQVEKRREAAAWYMTARAYEYQNKFSEAYEAYEKAIKIDDTAIPLYRSIIPLAFRLEKTEDAIRYAQKAVELDPDNFELLSQLGIYALRKRDVAGSIAYFEKAIDSQTVDKKGGPYISIMSQLGQLYLSIGQQEEAARAFAIVFDAITNPDDYSLDYRTQQALQTLQGNKTETFESFAELFLATDRLELAEKALDFAAKSTTKNPEAFSYQVARILARRNQPEEALKKLNEYFDAKLSVKGKGPYLLLSEILVASGREADVLPRLIELADGDPKNEALQFYLAEQYIAREKYEEAAAIYDRLSDSKQQDEVQLGRLQIERHRGNAEQVLAALTQSMLVGVNTARLEAELDRIGQDEKLTAEMIKIGLAEEEPEDKRAGFAQAYLLAKLAMQQGNVDNIVSFYERAMKLRPQTQVVVTLYAELVEYLTSKDEIETLVAVLEKAIESPDLVQQRQAFQLQLVQTFMTAERYEDALALIKKVRETDPDNLIWEYQEGRIHYVAQEWEEATRIFLPLLEKAKAQSNRQVAHEVTYNLSRCLAFGGHAPEAQKLISDAIADQPQELIWKFQRGWIYYYTHQWAESIKAFEDLISSSPDADPEDNIIRQTHFSLSAAYVQDKQFEKGEKILEVYYERNPDDISVCNDLGYLYADQNKKLDQAYEMIKKALDAEPENDAYLDSMGWVLYRLGRFEESLEYLEKAVVDSTEGDGVLWDHLGDCYAALKRDEKARQAWKTALDQEQSASYPDKSLITKLEEKLK
ncbi:MAG: tetratricopeptide repeat protein [Planctomycetaceae bacterium]|nr:tetratricopeptide repeat protein [Planctomycetaceae bacterium]